MSTATELARQRRRRPRATASSTPRSGSSTPTASAASAWTPSSPSPAWPRRRFTSTSRARTTSCWPTWTRSTRPGSGSCARPPRRPATGARATSWSACSTRWPRACRRDGYRGCAFINTAAEAEAGTDVHARTVEHKQLVRAWVADLAAAPAPPTRSGSPASSRCCSTAACPLASSTPIPPLRVQRSRPRSRSSTHRAVLPTDGPIVVVEDHPGLFSRLRIQPSAGSPHVGDSTQVMSSPCGRQRPSFGAPPAGRSRRPLAGATPNSVDGADRT